MRKSNAVQVQEVQPQADPLDLLLGQMGDFDLDQAIAEAEVPEPEEDAGKAPAVPVTGPLSWAVDAFAEAYDELAAAQAKVDQLKRTLAVDADPYRVQLCRRDGKFYSSVKLVSENGKLAQVQSRNRYRDVSLQTHGPRLQELCGARYRELFSQRPSIVIGKQALENRTFMALVLAMRKRFGAETIRVERLARPTIAYHTGRALSDDIAKLHKSLEDEGIVKQDAATVQPKRK